MERCEVAYVVGARSAWRRHVCCRIVTDVDYCGRWKIEDAPIGDWPIQNNGSCELTVPGSLDTTFTEYTPHPGLLLLEWRRPK